MRLDYITMKLSQMGVAGLRLSMWLSRWLSTCPSPWLSI